MSVQDERHVLLECPATAELRQTYNVTKWEEIHDIFKHEASHLSDMIQNISLRYRLQ